MSPAELRADLVRVARECGRPDGVSPSEEEYRRHGRFSPYAVMMTASEGRRRLVGGQARPRLTWAQSVKRLGVPSPETLRRNYVTPEKIIADLRRLARQRGEPGRVPSRGYYEKHGRFAGSGVIRKFGSWRAAAEAAGLTSRNRRPTQARMIRDYQRECALAGLKRGDVGLTCAEFDERIPYSSGNALDLFGSWATLVERAGFEPTRRGARGYGSRAADRRWGKDENRSAA